MLAASEALEAPGGNIPFSLEPVMVDLEGGAYVGSILPIQLADLVSGGGRGGGSGKENGIKHSGGSGGGSGASSAEKRKTNTSEREASVRLRYDAHHMAAFSLQDGDNSSMHQSGRGVPPHPPFTAIFFVRTGIRVCLLGI